jgi:ApaG protein
VSSHATDVPSSLADAPRAPRDPGSDTLSSGVRVRVKPFFLASQSDPAKGQYAWGYRVRITNESGVRARLLRRHWVIVDGDGDRHDVIGDGVVGHQPLLAPGEHFEYTSHCPLHCPWGTMEGAYTFVDDAGTEFPVHVGRFFLVSPHV